MYDRSKSLAPGARAVICDEEWLIHRVDPFTDGGWLTTCDGIAELVRVQNALLLTALLDRIEVLDPATTAQVLDDSPTYNPTLLCLESQRRRSVANDDRIHLGHRGVMNLVPYRFDKSGEISGYGLLAHMLHCGRSGFSISERR